MTTTTPTAPTPIITCGECGMELALARRDDPTFGKRLFIAHRSLGQCEALR